jgi:hypothetical protein
LIGQEDTRETEEEEDDLGQGLIALGRVERAGEVVDHAHLAWRPPLDRPLQALGRDHGEVGVGVQSPAAEARVELRDRL